MYNTNIDIEIKHKDYWVTNLATDMHLVSSNPDEFIIKEIPRGWPPCYLPDELIYNTIHKCASEGKFETTIFNYPHTSNQFYYLVHNWWVFKRMGYEISRSVHTNGIEKFTISW